MIRRRRSRRAKRRALVLLGLGTIVVVSLAVVGVGSARDLGVVRTRLTAAREALGVLRGDVDRLATEDGRGQARTQVETARAELASARRQLVRSLPLDVAGVLPGVRFQRAGLEQLIDDVEAAALAADRVIVATGELERRRPGDATVPLARVAAFEQVVRGSAKELRRVSRGERGLWGALARARRDFEAVTRPAASRLNVASDTVAAFRGFFGQSEPRRYFVAGMNNAEMRDQGMVLSFAVVRFEGGNLTVERTDPIETVELKKPAPIELPPGTTKVFGPLLPTQQWRSINATADFATTARSAVAMYEAATGERLDGVIGLDVPALAAILRVTGPVTLPSVGEMTGESVTPFLLSGQYDGMASGAPQRQRRDRVAEVADVVAERLRAGDVDRVDLGRSLAAAAAGRHLLVWSARTEETEAFDRAGLTGSLVPVDDSREVPTIHVAVQDATGTKLDYLVRPRLKIDIKVTEEGAALIKTTVSVENQAPIGAPPSYALGPNNPSTTRPGQYVTRVYHWGPLKGSQSDSVVESGLRLSQQPILVEPGSTGELVFDTAVPGAVRGGEMALRLVPQPRHVPMPVDVTVTEPSGARRTFRGDLPQTRTFRWEIGPQ